MNLSTLTNKELFQEVAKALKYVDTPDVIYFDKAIAVELFNQYGLDARRFGDVIYVTISKGKCVKTEEAQDFETAVFRAFVSASLKDET